MPRTKVVPMGDGTYQVAVLANNPSEQPGRMTIVNGLNQVKEATKTLMEEWELGRQARREKLAQSQP
jgi:hypothetical protein